MGRIYTDTEKLLKAAELSRNGHHKQAESIYQRMGNEYRNSSEKKQLWEMAKESRRKYNEE